METENYRKWIPALIIGLVLCLPIITWLLAGTFEHHHAAPEPPSTAPESPEIEV